jgi:hypothetical protein
MVFSAFGKSTGLTASGVSRTLKPKLNNLMNKPI